MIAELFPELYDVQGRKTFRPSGSQRHEGFRPTFPMGRYLTQPLRYPCRDFAEMRKFLGKCRARNLNPPNTKRDYWQPPEEFEETRAGDCADFAIWAWRQVLEMGYSARFTGGRAGKFGEGHAWVTFEKDGRFFLLEPQMWYVGPRMPRLSILRYHPSTSVSWDGQKVSYYAHEARNTEPPLRRLPALIGEWLVIWGRFWFRIIPQIPIAVGRKISGRTAERA